MLVVEDGTGTNPGANSYVDLVYARSYAALRGFTLPTLDIEATAFLIRAMDYIETRPYCGHKVSTSQPCQWPRTGVYVDCELLPTNIVPAAIANSQVEVALAYQSGNDLQPTLGTQGEIIEEMVDVLRVKYATPQRSIAVNTKVDTMLKPYLCGGSLAFRVGRI